MDGGWGRSVERFDGSWRNGFSLAMAVVGFVGAGTTLASGNARGALFCLGGGVVFAFAALARALQSVEVFERGFVVRRVWGTTSVPGHAIDEVATVNRDGEIGLEHGVRVTLTSGERVTITGMPEEDRLVSHLVALARSARDEAAGHTSFPTAPRTPKS